MNQFNWDGTFSVDFDLTDGLSKTAEVTKRHLSQMAGMYQDQEAVKKILEKEDPVIYEFYELGCPERAGDLAFGTTMIHPGTIGDEYYMTKGHFHNIGSVLHPERGGVYADGEHGRGLDGGAAGKGEGSVRAPRICPQNHQYGKGDAGSVLCVCGGCGP